MGLEKSLTGASMAEIRNWVSTKYRVIAKYTKYSNELKYKPTLKFPYTRTRSEDFWLNRFEFGCLLADKLHHKYHTYYAANQQSKWL